MKVAYNACYGGFGLSNLALDLYSKKKGITLHWYNREGYNPSVYTKADVLEVSGKDLFSSQCFTQDIGQNATSYPKDSYYSPSFYDDSSRADKDLIDVIEALGDSASGSCAALRIEEIPDVAEFEIDEYDGFESVVPPRQSW